MSKRVLTKLVGSINAFLFLALSVFFIVLEICSALIEFVIENIGFITRDFLYSNFKFYTDLIPLSMPSMIVIMILIGILFILSVFGVHSSKGLIKISNREVVGFYKKRGSISAKIFYIWLMAIVFFTGLTTVSLALKISSIVIGVWLIISSILLIVDKKIVKKEYFALKHKLENVEKVNALGSKADADTITAVLEDENNNIGLSNDRGQLVINEIAKLDKLKKEGVISAVEYTRMRERTIKNYGKKI